MNKEIKEKWLEALRSGEYAQGVGLLCKFNSEGNAEYCCLGVLIEVVEGENAWEEYSDVLRHDGMQGFPSEAFTESVGLDQELVNALAKQNDEGATFEELADVIEEQA